MWHLKKRYLLTFAKQRNIEKLENLEMEVNKRKWKGNELWMSELGGGGSNLASLFFAFISAKESVQVRQKKEKKKEKKTIVGRKEDR